MTLYWWRCTAKHAGCGWKERKMDGEAHKRDQEWEEDSGDVMISLTQCVWYLVWWVLYWGKWHMWPRQVLLSQPQRVRDTSGVKNWCALHTAAERRGMMLDFGSEVTMLVSSLLLNYIPLICFWVRVSFCNLFSYMLNPHGKDLFWGVFLTSLCVESYQTSWSLLLLAY